MTNSIVLSPTKLVSVEPDGANAKGVVAFRDYKGAVLHLDFVAYGETAKKLQSTKLGSKFDADGSLDIFKERNYLTVFSISSVSGVRAPEEEGATPEEAEQVVQAIAKTPVAPITPVAPKAALVEKSAAPDYDSIPF